MLAKFRIPRIFLVALGACFAGQVAMAQDFDPRGRKRPKPGNTTTSRPTTKPAVPADAAKPGDVSKPAKTVPQNVLIERYIGIVLAQPGSPFPLQRLAQLYRDRDGNIKALVTEFETRAGTEGASQYASILALGGIYKMEGRADLAISSYERALAMKDSDAAPLLALARLYQDRAEYPLAKSRYEQALLKQTVPQDREQTIRTLLSIALEQKDWDEAKRLHQKLVDGNRTSLFLKGELGREFLTRGEYARAEIEFQEIVKLAQGDNRVLAPALKDLGRAQAKAGNSKEAIATLKRALASAGGEAGVRGEVLETIAEVYRKEQRLPELVKDLEAQHPQDFPRLRLLGTLYEETGDGDKAIATFRRAIAVQPKELDLRIKVVRLLQARGEVDKALVEYEALFRAAPNNPTFVFELVETLVQRGSRDRALGILGELESRAGTDEDVLSRLADQYGRMGEKERSLRILQKLSQMGSSDPSHLVDLGDRYFQDGNKALALTTWRRLATVVVPRTKGLSALADVYLDHEMLEDALQTLREALTLEPQNLGVRKQLAIALERAQRTGEAKAAWADLARKDDKNIAREARTHLVKLWAQEKSIDAQAAALKASFAKNPSDLDTGRLLAEVQLHQRNLADAESTLRVMIAKVPGEPEGYLTLERVLVQQGKLQEAIVVLEKLLEVDPKRARELYQRMSQYAISAYRDEDAIKYAARAVALNPDDAELHRRLGDMYRSKQDPEKAILSYQQAIAKNDRLFLVYFQLADLLLARGQSDDADRLFRRVIRSSPDDELLARAARLSMQINGARGTLETLEQDLLPLSIANPTRLVLRRLLIEIYGALASSLVAVAKRSDSVGENARTRLAALGERAIKPLLDALSDKDLSGQRVAIDVLRYVRNKNASAPLFAYTQSSADVTLRVRAMVACGELREPLLLPKLEGVLFPKGAAVVGADPLSVAAAFAVIRTGGPKSLPVLRRMLAQGSTDVQAFGAIGLGLLQDSSSINALAELVQRPDVSGIARASAVFALGRLGANSQVSLVMREAQSPDRVVRDAALLALGELPILSKPGPQRREAQDLLLRALFAEASVGARSQTKREQEVALAGLSKLARPPQKRDLAAPEGVVRAEPVLAMVSGQDLSVEDRVALFATFREDLERVAIDILQNDKERAPSVLEVLASDAFAPFVFAGEKNADAVAANARIATAGASGVIRLARSADLVVRSQAFAVLGRMKSAEGDAVVQEALSSPDEASVRMAMLAIGHENQSAAIYDKLASYAKSHADWTLRALSAETLGKASGNPLAKNACLKLEDVALHDSFAIVRQTALSSLNRCAPGEARALATRILGADVEPRVRETAKAILAK